MQPRLYYALLHTQMIAYNQQYAFIYLLCLTQNRLYHNPTPDKLLGIGHFKRPLETCSLQSECDCGTMLLFSLCHTTALTYLNESC